MMSEKKEGDVVFLGPCDENGSHAAIRYRSGKLLDSGIVRRLEHGRSISGEPVRLHPQEDGPGNDVEYLLKENFEDPVQSEGPVMVNSQEYRDNWDNIFKRKGLFGSEIRPGSA